MADRVVRVTPKRGVWHVVMGRGANALDEGLMQELLDTLRKLREASSPPVLLCSAHTTLFSPGWDLKLLGSAARDRMASFLALFNQLVFELFSYPGPTAAAVDGHAIAGGCLLALACDRRVMSSGRPRIGLSEVNLGVPVPIGSMTMLCGRLGHPAVEELVFGGDGLTAQRAQHLGLVQKVAGAGEAIALAERELHRLLAKPRAAYEAAKRYIFRDLWATMERFTEEDDRDFLECWFSQETQRRLLSVVTALRQPSGATVAAPKS